MNRSDKIITKAAFIATGVLIYLSNKVAAQFTDEQEAKHYRKRQSLLSAGASAGAALMFRAAVSRLKRRRQREAK